MNHDTSNVENTNGNGKSQTPTCSGPIAIEVQRSLSVPNGLWHSSVSVKLTKALRKSGLLAALPYEDFKNLVYLLTFADATGRCMATVTQLSQAMLVSEAKVRRRMVRLIGFRWHGKPIVQATHHGNGSDAYTVVTEDNGIAEAVESIRGQTSSSSQPIPELPDASPDGAGIAPNNTGVRPNDGDVTSRVDGGDEIRARNQENESPHYAPKEKVIEASRRRYGRPRAEVERTIAEQMGWSKPPYLSVRDLIVQLQDKPIETKAEAKEWLQGVGVNDDRVDSLLANFDAEQIIRQINWLPNRNARDPVGFVVAAIEGDYDEPYTLKKQA